MRKDITEYTCDMCGTVQERLATQEHPHGTVKARWSGGRSIATQELNHVCSNCFTLAIDAVERLMSEAHSSFKSEETTENFRVTSFRSHDGFLYELRQFDDGTRIVCRGDTGQELCEWDSGSEWDLKEDD